MEKKRFLGRIGGRGVITVKDLIDGMDGITDWIKRLTFPNGLRRRRPAHFVPLLCILKAMGKRVGTEN